MHDGISHMVAIPIGGPVLLGYLSVPPEARGIVVVADGSGSGRDRPVYRVIADRLGDRALATLLVDLLTEREGSDLANRFDVELLTDRLLVVTDWVRAHPASGELPVSYLGSNTGSAAVVRAATEPENEVAALVALGGRVDLAGDAVDRDAVPTLVVVGERDRTLRELLRVPFERLPGEKAFETVPGAGHAFERLPEVVAAAESTADWVLSHSPGAPSVDEPGPDRRRLASAGERSDDGAVEGRPDRDGSRLGTAGSS